MNTQDLERLAALIKRERDALLSQWREQVPRLPSAKYLETPALNDHVPALLDELAAALHLMSDQTIPEALLVGSSPAHGMHRHQDRFDIVEVVAEYNIQCEADCDQNGAKTLITRFRSHSGARRTPIVVPISI